MLNYHSHNKLIMDSGRPKSSQVKDLISDYNKQAIELLTNQKFSESYSLLKKAEKLLNHIDSEDRLQSITYNNLGCFFKTVQKMQPALEMFIKSLALNNFDKSLQAGTHLNVCSILSSLGSHKKALDHGLTAFKILQKINESDSSCASSLLYASFITAKEYEHLNQLSQAENLYTFGEQLSQEFNLETFNDKITEALSNLKRKKLIGSKPRFSSVSRRTELPSIKTNQSDYAKKFLIIEEKRKFSPRVLRTYPPILDIPFSRQMPRSSELPVHKKTRTNINEIKKELLEYEEKFKRLTGTGKRNLKIRSAKVSHAQKTPAKPIYYMQEFSKKPVSAPCVDLNKVAVVIQKNWRAFKARQSCRQERRKVAQRKAREAIEELELLKIQAKNDEMFVQEEIWRPKTYSPLKRQKSDKMYKTLGKFPKSGFSLHEKLSIIKIQSFCRMVIQRSRFKRLMRSTTLIQKNVKKFQCAKLFQKITSAILFIQYQWRKANKRNNSLKTN